MTVEPRRLLSIAGRPPGTSPPVSMKLGREAIEERWEANAAMALAILEEARRTSGMPLPTARVLSLLRKTPPGNMHPLQKRGWLQVRRLIEPLGDGTWDIPQR